MLLKLVSTFTFDAVSLAGAGGVVLLDGPAMGDVEVRGATVDGKPATAHVLRVRPWTLCVPVVFPASGKVVVVVTYDSRQRGDQPLYHLGRYQLLRPARLVDVAGKTGWDLRPLSPFSYADRLPVSLRLHRPATYAVLAPSPTKDAGGVADLKTTSLAHPVIVMGPRDAWSVSELEVKGTVFRIVLPARNAELRVAELKAVIAAAWPKLVARLGPEPRGIITFIETEDGSLSGGLLGDDVVGLFIRKKTSPFEQIFIRNILGWEMAPSTRAYVTREYKASKDPWHDYLTGMVTHELAHFWFGFGKSTERVVETSDEWTSLGLGLLYDNQVTRELTGREPELFVASERVWQTRWAKDPGIDQRLVHPNTRQDPPALTRTQTYAHSKALWTFRELRAKLGAKVFDKAVAAYLAAPADDPDEGWARLRRELLKVAPGLPAHEKELGL